MKILDIFDDTYIHSKDAKDQLKKVFTKDIKQWLGKTFFLCLPLQTRKKYYDLYSKLFLFDALVEVIENKELNYLQCSIVWNSIKE